jgi:short subunit dehydrogenase-like uncharacterized protein
MNKKLDVIIYGATGFTGSLCVKYFKTKYPEIKWGIAGRNKNKLKGLHKFQSLDCEIFIADAYDSYALDKLTERTKVLLSTVGPFYRYGTKVVESCVKNRTHYVDITGETFWIKEIILKFHQEAKDKSVRIIPSCGFDSIPSDLGSLFSSRNCENNVRSIYSFYKWKGEASGGSIETLFSSNKTKIKESFLNCFSLNPKNSVSDIQKKQTSDKVKVRKNNYIDSWIGPFIMGSTNASIVRRSAALLDKEGRGYGKNFIYKEHAYFSSKWSAYISTILLGLFIFSVFTPAKKVIRFFLRKPGEGPSQKVMDEGFFKGKFLVTEENNNKTIFEVYGKGDPGYKLTSMFVCESAISLLEDEVDLPGGKGYGGILTPSSGLGQILINRLINEGISFRKIK